MQDSNLTLSVNVLLQRLDICNAFQWVFYLQRAQGFGDTTDAD
jgi:hypothetical protein